MQQEREADARRAANDTEQQAFDQQLTRDARAAGAERGANRHLPRSHGRSRQLQASDIGGGRGEQQADGDEQHDERAPHVGGQRLAEGLRRDPNRTIAPEDGHGRHAGVRGQPATRRSFGDGLRRGDTRPEQPDRAEEREVVAGRRPDRERHEGAGLPIRVRDRVRQDTDDGIGLAVEVLRVCRAPPDQRRSAAARGPPRAPRPAMFRPSLRRTSR